MIAIQRQTPATLTLALVARSRHSHEQLKLSPEVARLRLVLDHIVLPISAVLDLQL